jgi:hypothetical protein
VGRRTGIWIAGRRTRAMEERWDASALDLKAEIEATGGAAEDGALAVESAPHPYCMRPSISLPRARRDGEVAPRVLSACDIKQSHDEGWLGRVRGKRVTTSAALSCGASRPDLCSTRAFPSWRADGRRLLKQVVSSCTRAGSCPKATELCAQFVLRTRSTLTDGGGEGDGTDPCLRAGLGPNQGITGTAVLFPPPMNARHLSPAIGGSAQTMIRLERRLDRPQYLELRLRAGSGLTGDLARCRWST